MATSRNVGCFLRLFFAVPLGFLGRSLWGLEHPGLVNIVLEDGSKCPISVSLS